MTALLIGALAILLIITTRNWLVLRGRQRQRGLFRRWPVPTIAVEAHDPRFLPDEFRAVRRTPRHGFLRCSRRTLFASSSSEPAPEKRPNLGAQNRPSGGTVTTLTLGPGEINRYEAAPGDDPTAEADAKAGSAFTRFRYTGTEVEGRVRQLFGDRKQFDETPYLGTCDIVFVDGSHAYSYVVNDSRKALRTIRPVGLVLWHDYSPDCPAVFRALNGWRPIYRWGT